MRLAAVIIDWLNHFAAARAVTDSEGGVANAFPMEARKLKQSVHDVGLSRWVEWLWIRARSHVPNVVYKLEKPVWCQLSSLHVHD